MVWWYGTWLSNYVYYGSAFFYHFYLFLYLLSCYVSPLFPPPYLIFQKFLLQLPLIKQLHHISHRKPLLPPRACRVSIV
jgi:hypothetical protein